MDDFLYSVTGHVATVTINRPERLNALTVPMSRQFVEIIDDADDNDEVRAIIVTGKGRTFSAGADLRAGGKTFDRSSSTGVHRDEGGLMTLRLFACRKPVIAAINGPAIGLGASLTLPMDIRLASVTAQFGFVFANRGIAPDGCSSWFLPRLVGISRASEWMYTGCVLPADEALACGLVQSIHEPNQLMECAQELAAKIAAASSPVSVAATRQLLWRMLGAPHPIVANRAESIAISATGRSLDALEGVNSFLEKRPPQFTGSVRHDLPDMFPRWPEPSYDLLDEIQS